MINSKQASQNKDKNKAKDAKLPANKQHYLYNSKLYDLNLNANGTGNGNANGANLPVAPGQLTSNTTFDQKLGVTRAKDPVAEALIMSMQNSVIEEEKSALSLDKGTNRSMSDLRRSAVSTSKKLLNKDKDKYLKDGKELVKFPPIRKASNPEDLGALKME